MAQIRCSDEFHEYVRQAAFQRNLNMGELIERATREWLAPGGIFPPPEESVDLLRQLLASGDADAVSIVNQTIRFLLQRLRQQLSPSPAEEQGSDSSGPRIRAA